MPGSAAAKGGQSQPFLDSDSDSDFLSDSGDDRRGIRSASSQSYQSDYGTTGHSKDSGTLYHDDVQTSDSSCWLSLLNCCCMPCGLIGFACWAASDYCGTGCSRTVRGCTENQTVQVAGLACALYCASGREPGAQSNCCGCC